MRTQLQTKEQKASVKSLVIYSPQEEVEDDDESEFSWDCFKEEMDKFFDSTDYGIIMFGYNDKWNGRFAAGTIAQSFDEILGGFSGNYDLTFTIDKNGHLFLDAAHSDGTNHYELKVITKRGDDYLSKNEHNMAASRLHSQVFNNSRYSHVCNYDKFFQINI